MQLQQQEKAIERLGLQVVVVTFETLAMARLYAGEIKLTWPLLVDESRQLAAGYGMHRARKWDLYGPAAIWVYIKLMLRGRKVRMPTADVNQLGGDVLIDPEGIVRVHHVGNGPADRPEVKAILDLVEQQNGG